MIRWLIISVLCVTFGIVAALCVVNLGINREGQNITLIVRTHRVMPDIFALHEQSKPDKNTKKSVGEAKNSGQKEIEPTVKSESKNESNDKKESNLKQNIKSSADSERGVKTWHQISILITNLGLNKKVMDEAMVLPKAVNFGFSVYAEHLPDLAKQAGDHNILINIPMESASKFNGKLALRAHSTQNLMRLNMILSLIKDYNGVYTSSDEKFSQDDNMMRKIIEHIKNIYFVYEGKNPKIAQIAKGLGVKFFTVDTTLDDNPRKIASSLKAAEELSRHKKFILIVCNASYISIKALREWLVLPHQFKLVELSAVNY